MSQLPSARQFLVHAEPGTLDELAASLPEGVDMTVLADEGVILIELKSVAADPHATWIKLMESLRDADWASPVVLDDSEEAHLPTGDVTVRFREAPSATQLKHFAKAHRLELRRRNEFIDEQVAFRPSDLRGTYLPDLVSRLLTEEGVSKAWLNTKSHYRRE